MNPQNQSPLDHLRSSIEPLFARGLTWAELLSQLEDIGIHTTDRSLRRAAKRWGIERTPVTPQESGKARAEKQYVKVNNNTAEFVSKPSPGIGSPEDLMKDAGLDPKDWDIDDVTVNKYNAMTGKQRDNERVWMYQLKVKLKRKVAWDFLMPANPYRPRVNRVKAAPAFPRLDYTAKLVVFVGDQQAPYHDPVLHKKFCQWLEVNQPEEGYMMGDTIDLPQESRHPENPEWDVDVQECVETGFSLTRDYVESSETKWKKLIGNHDERIRAYILKYAKNLYKLKPADNGKLQRSVWDIRNLLHLDELGVDLIVPNGGYKNAQANVSDHLAARHGWLASKGSGTTALSTLDALGYSVVVGHTHRQAVVHKTKHDIKGTTSTHVAVETGCMCLIREGLGYAVAPDWQNGFATAIVWPDGTFKAELATYVDGHLYWRDQRH